MATVTGLEISYRDSRSNPLVAQSWSALTTANDRGSPFEWPLGADRSIHVYGNEGTGGTLVLEGSNKEAPTDDDADWVALNDTEGSAISVTAVPDLTNVGTLARWVRPRVTAGDGSTSYNVILIARRR